MSKVLSSLPNRFDMKVIVVEETHDVKNMQLVDLLGSLKTFEMKLKVKEPEKKNKDLALKAETYVENEDQEEMYDQHY